MKKQISKKSKLTILAAKSTFERVKPRLFSKKTDSKEKKKTKPKKQEFPNNYRIIPDSTSAKAGHKKPALFLKNIVKLESFWAGILMGIILIAIGIVSLDLAKNLSEKNKIETEKSKIQSEIKFWEGITQKYKGYRDAYFKLALLEYQMGNTGKSRSYLKEVYKIDPNFEEGKEFEKLLDTK